MSDTADLERRYRRLLKCSRTVPVANTSRSSSLRLSSGAGQAQPSVRSFAWRLPVLWRK